MPEPLKEVGTDGNIPVVDKPSYSLTVELIPSGHMVRKHDSGIRAGSVGACKIGVHIVTVVPFDGDELGGHACVGICLLFVPHVLSPSLSVSKTVHSFW
jgi:hypothetical protein